VHAEPLGLRGAQVGNLWAKLPLAYLLRTLACTNPTTMTRLRHHQGDLNYSNSIICCFASLAQQKSSSCHIIMECVTTSQTLIIPWFGTPHGTVEQ